MLHRRSWRATTASARAGDPRLELLAREALDQPFAAGRRLAAATLAVPGIVDDFGGVVMAPNLHWDVPVTRMLSEARPGDHRERGEPGALAELTEGAGSGLRDFVYISGEIGIGAGIVIGGDLFRGARVRRRDRAPHDRRLRAAVPVRLARLPRAARGSGGDPAARRLGPARTRAGSRPEWRDARRVGARRSREDARGAQPGGHTLGIAAATAVNLLNPEALLLGGYFAPLTERLREPIENELHRRLLAGDGSGCAVLAARLGGEAAGERRRCHAGRRSTTWLRSAANRCTPAPSAERVAAAQRRHPALPAVGRRARGASYIPAGRSGRARTRVSGRSEGEYDETEDRSRARCASSRRRPARRSTRPSRSSSAPSSRRAASA